MKKYQFLTVSALLLTALAGCKSEEDVVVSPQAAKVTIIDPIGYAQNMGAWIPATEGGRKKLLLEEGKHYTLSAVCEPSGVEPSSLVWRVVNNKFEEASVSADGIVTGVKEDPDNGNLCLVVAAASPTVSDVIEIKVLKELSGVYEIKVANPDIVIPDGGSIRSTVRVTSSSNAGGDLYNRDLITGFFSDKNRANFNDAVTVSFISGSAFDIQANGPGVNIMLAYSKAYISSTPGESRTFDSVRDYAVLVSNNKRQALQVDSAYVSLDKHNVHLLTGESFQLTSRLVCANAGKPSVIAYSSSNPEVATVDHTGKVTAVGRGLATVIAFTNHLAESHECVVNVDDAAPVAVTRIADQPDFTNTHTVTRKLIVEGQTMQLYSDSHRDELNAASGTLWHSSDPAVVRVDDNGLVTAVGHGTGIIYATPYVDASGTQAKGISDCGAFTVMPDYTQARVGDIFYSDGSFCTDLQPGKTPVGIIAYLHCDANGTPVAAAPSTLTESGELSQYGAIGADRNFHGLVMSLRNAATAVKWGRDAASAQLAGVTVANGDAATMFNSTGATNSSGFNAVLYTNGADIITGAPAFRPAESYPACYAAWHYDVGLPGFVTNWFLPSAPQWYAVLYNGLGGLRSEGITPAWNTAFNSTAALQKINAALDRVGVPGVDKFPANALLWTANEGDTEGKTATALLVNGDGLKFTAVSKTAATGEGSEPSVVRCFFAF